MTLRNPTDAKAEPITPVYSHLGEFTPSPYSVAGRLSLALENDTLRRERDALALRCMILETERDEARALSRTC